eukprot:scaffold101831_cov15-Tisochrysis_lutea.AAC.2
MVGTLCGPGPPAMPPPPAPGAPPGPPGVPPCAPPAIVPRAAAATPANPGAEPGPPAGAALLVPVSPAPPPTAVMDAVPGGALELAPPPPPPTPPPESPAGPALAPAPLRGRLNSMARCFLPRGCPRWGSGCCCCCCCGSSLWRWASSPCA